MLPIDPLDLSRYPLALAPSDRTGWFGGASIVALDPVSRQVGVGVAEAAQALEAAFTAPEFTLAAALIGYDGTAEVRTYAGAHTAVGSDWVAHGDARDARPILGSVRCDMTQPEWADAVHELQQAIEAGDVYVANLTMRLAGEARLGPAEAFERLRVSPGALMAAIFGSPQESVVSVSPERFLGVRLAPDGIGRIAEVWPIKGTAPRGSDSRHDEQLAAELERSDKERAEHVMIVDLERNDLGVVCRPGTIAVDPMMSVFPTRYCHQMMSRVTGVLRDDASFAELMGATFPCGSVTGAPKRAAMRLIERLEATPRGCYTGALLVALPGRLDSSVLIRTLEYSPDGSAACGTGCGITIDSDPAAEWAEAWLKASPVLG